MRHIYIRAHDLHTRPTVTASLYESFMASKQSNHKDLVWCLQHCLQNLIKLHALPQCRMFCKIYSVEKTAERTNIPFSKENLQDLMAETVSSPEEKIVGSSLDVLKQTNQQRPITTRDYTSYDM